MKRTLLPTAVTGLVLFTLLPFAWAQTGTLRFPNRIEAATRLSIATAGSGEATLYIAGPGAVIRRTVRLGEAIELQSSDTANAGHYVAWLISSSGAETAEFDIVAAQQPSSLSFFAKPSRLPIDQQGGISGVVYVFDAHRNLILEPTRVSFHLGDDSQGRNVTTENGVAWIRINSAAKAGPVQFVAAAGNIAEKRVVQQVPGEPCSLRMNTRRVGSRLALETEPVRDCRGNPLPDGTVVTFTEMRDGRPAASADAPLKHDVAKTELPAYEGGVISVALGVTMGDEVRVGAVR